MFNGKQNTHCECLDHEDVHGLRDKRDVKPKLLDCPPPSVTSQRTFRSPAGHPWQVCRSHHQEAAQLESTGTAGIHVQDYLMLGPVHPFPAGLLFSQQPEVPHGHQCQCQSGHSCPCTLLLCTVPTSVCNRVKCGFSLTVSFSKSVALLIPGFSAC